MDVCDRCKFFFIQKNVVGGIMWYECRRRAPVVDNGNGGFPTISEHDYCGEFEPSNGEQAQPPAA